MSEAKEAPRPPRRATTETGLERRLSVRVLVDLEVDYASEENYLFAYITDISTTGIFVRTTTPEAPGTHLNLRFTQQLPLELRDVHGYDAQVFGLGLGLGLGLDGGDGDGDDGARAAHDFELEGEVIWWNPYRPGQPDNLHPGMGIRFLGLDTHQRERLVDLVRRIAYLA